MATNQSLIRAEICKAVSLPMDEIKEPEYDGVWCNYILHSAVEGILESIDINPDFEQRYIKDKGLIVEKGDHIVPFTGANTSLGTLFLRAETREELDKVLANVHENIKICLS